MRGARRIDERRRTYGVRRSEVVERNEAGEPFSMAGWFFLAPIRVGAQRQRQNRFFFLPPPMGANSVVPGAIRSRGEWH